MESGPMVRMLAVVMVAGVALLPPGPAHADFVLGSVGPGALPAARYPRAVPALEAAQDTPEQVAPPFKLARGFGDAVPLSFAVRQIVPPAVKVRYGAGIDPDAVVSWKGDRPWNQALAAAVQPLRLRIVTGTDTVLITR